MALSGWKECILQGIFRDIEKGIVDEKNLERLENLVEILHKEGSKVPKSLKEAYCQVATECTARCLSYEKDSKEAYIESIRSIWLRRVMPLCDKVSCLVTRELLSSCRRLWIARSDVKACENLIGEDTREQALVSLRKVVSELHPNHDYGLDESDDGNESVEVESSDEIEETEPMVEARELVVYRNANKASEAMEEDKESQPEPEAELEKSITERPELRKIRPVPTPVYNKVRRDLKDAMDDLMNVLKDGEGPSNTAVAEQENDVDDPSATYNASRPSLMERKTTAETYEWKDSIDDDSDGEAGDDGERKKRQRVVVSPLARNQKGSRRPYVPWCTAETLAVMKGYEKYGANWKKIRNECPILIRRTSVDIKDKFRAEMKRQERHRLGRK